MNIKQITLVLTLVAIAISLQVFAIDSAPVGTDIAAITMNTPAVEEAVKWYEPAVKGLLNAVINFLWTALLGYFSGAYDYLRKKLSISKHGQALAILLDSLKVSISNTAKKNGKHYSEMITDLVSFVSDGKLDPDEKKRIKAMRDEIRTDAIEAAHASFKELRGWSKDKGSEWIAERIDLLLGELESRLFVLKEN